MKLHIYKKSIEYLKQSLKINPRCYKAHNLIAKIYLLNN